VLSRFYRNAAAIFLGGFMTVPGYSADDLIVYRCVSPDHRVRYTDSDESKSGETCKRVDSIIFGAISAPKATSPALDVGKRHETIKPLSMREAKEILERDLRDPEATHYKDVFVSKTGDVCGRMNTKNAFGGYVGYVDFVVRAEGGAPLTLADTSRWTFAGAWDKHCKRK
jgi:hypothetical protein